MTGRRSLIALVALGLLLASVPAHALEVGQKFEAAGAQVVGVSADHAATLDAFTRQQGVKHLLLSDFRRAMLPAYDAMETNEQSPIFRYARRAYFVIDREGIVRYRRIQPNALDLLKPEEVLQAFRDSGVR
jgi:peroxiredoxin